MRHVVFLPMLRQVRYTPCYCLKPAHQVGLATSKRLMTFYQTLARRTVSSFGDMLRRRLNIRRIKLARKNSRFYPQLASCQIPVLEYLFESVFGEKGSGFFVEVGAYDGLSTSNSWGLAEAGWSGLLVEPQPRKVAECIENHKDHPAVQTIQTAIGKTGETKISLQMASALTTARADLLQEYKKVKWAKGALTEESITVSSCTLDALLERYDVPSGFEVLIVDVEGSEVDVMSGFSLATWHPVMIIIELSDSHPDISSGAADSVGIQIKLTENGYYVAYKDSINTVFVLEESWKSSQELRSGALV